MYPSYMRITGFDDTHTRFAKKYSLFLYREQGKDPDFKVQRGIPVLFIPGNAGSYKQVRSIASQTTNLYLDSYLNQEGKSSLDFFTADFNEDLTAFHGRTMLDQAEYLNEAIKFILSLYELDPEPERPKSVIVIGHSMGGIVARAILTLPNYIQDTVNTIITLAAPHSAAPATFDGDILRIYSEIDDFWRSAFKSEGVPEPLHKLAWKRLENVSLISITGGLSDNTLPADYTRTDGLIPSDHSFTVFTTGIPDVYTTIDHLAIVWCDQLRKKLAQVLLEISVSSNDCTLPLPKRMETFRRLLLSGFEDVSRQDSDVFALANGVKKFDIRLKMDNDHINSNILRIPSKIHQSLKNEKGNINMFNIDKSSENLQFTLLSSLDFVSVKDLSYKTENPAIVGCKMSNSLDDDMFLVDFTTLRTINFAELDCIDLVNDIHMIPRSMLYTKSVSESSFGGEYQPFKVIQYDPDLVSNFDAILIIESPMEMSGEDFIIGELQPTDLTQLTLGEDDPWKLILKGYDLSLPSRRPLAVDISIPSAWSSLLSYRVTVNGITSLNISKQSFAPFVRQSIDTPFETKWHIGLHQDDSFYVTLHANSPFMQYHQFNKSHLHLQLWTDSLMMDESPLDIYVSVDILGSLKLLVLRYRLSVISFPVAVCFLVLALQLNRFISSGEFISFWDGLLQLCQKRVLNLVNLFLISMAALSRVDWIANLISLLNPVRFADLSFDDYKKDSMFLGLNESYLIFLGPLFFMMSIALVATVYETIMIVGELVTFAYGFIMRLSKNNGEPVLKESLTTGGLQIFRTKKQVIGTVLLCGAVSIYIPYQLAYIICCIIQIVVVFRALIRLHYHNNRYKDAHYLLEEDKSMKVEQTVSPLDKRNSLNYHITILNLMLWIIPINIPVVVVFLHNFSVRWSTPFSSHHNLLAILPVLLVVEKHVTGRMIVRNERLQKLGKVLILMSIYIAVFSFIFGTRNLFFLHHLLSLFLGVSLFSF